jgi:hypothetical protein
MALAMLLRKEILGLLESLVLKVLKEWLWHTVTWAQGVVRRLGDDGEAAVRMKLGRRAARARR